MPTLQSVGLVWTSVFCAAKNTCSKYWQICVMMSGFVVPLAMLTVLLLQYDISKYCQNFMLIWKYEDIKYARFHKIKSPCSLFLHLLHHIRCKQFSLPWMDNGAVNSSNLIFWNSQIGWICKIVLIMQICWCWFFKFREPAKYYFADFFR